MKDLSKEGNIKVSVDFLWDVLKKAKDCETSISGGIRSEKPSRYQSGNTANVARICFDGVQDDEGGSYLATDKDGIIDLDATIKRLKKATEIVEKICGDATNNSA